MNQRSRMMAVEIKRAVMTCYGTSENFGFETAQRALWEIGDTIADIHGRRKAVEAIYRIADDILARDHADVLSLPPVPEEPLGAEGVSFSDRARAIIGRNAFLSVYVAFCVGVMIGGSV
jgi:hypothetical protein